MAPAAPLDPPVNFLAVSAVTDDVITSNLPSLCTNSGRTVEVLSDHYLRNFTMFRVALRRSSRAVGSISATGRIASVSRAASTATFHRSLVALQVSLYPRKILRSAQICPTSAEHGALPWPLASRSSANKCLPQHRRAALRKSQRHRIKSEAMLMPKLPLPKCLRSLSRELEVCRRRLVLLRPAECCLSGRRFAHARAERGLECIADMFS